MTPNVVARREVPVTLVDSDVHPTVPTAAIVEYIPEPWRTRFYRDLIGEVEMHSQQYLPPRSERTDAIPASGAGRVRPCSHLRAGSAC
jgi:hypothetical protein